MSQWKEILGYLAETFGPEAAVFILMLLIVIWWLATDNRQLRKRSFDMADRSIEREKETVGALKDAASAVQDNTKAVDRLYHIPPARRDQ